MSDHTIRPGDICEVLPFASCYHETGRPYIGTRVTVLTSLCKIEVIVGGLAHQVMAHDGKTFFCQPKILRKIEPPREDLQLVCWTDCPWQPAQVHA